MGRIYDYKTNYSHYLQLRKERREQQQKQFDDQAKQIADIQEFIERFKGTYSKTLQVQSRVKMLEKIEIVEVDEVDTSALESEISARPAGQEAIRLSLMGYRKSMATTSYSKMLPLQSPAVRKLPLWERTAKGNPRW